MTNAASLPPKFEPYRILSAPITSISAWRIGSFSGLAAGKHMEAPDRDSLSMPDASEPGAGVDTPTDLERVRALLAG